MNFNNLKVGATYYIIFYSFVSKKWELLPSVLYTKESMNDGRVFCEFSRGGIMSDFVFDKLIDAVGKQNRMNFMEKHINNAVFYNGRKIQYKLDEGLRVMGMITEMNFNSVVPSFRFRPMPWTDYAKNHCEYPIDLKISDVGIKFSLI